MQAEWAKELQLSNIMNFYKDPPTSERPSPPKGIDGKITISLTRAEAEELLDELQSLHGYHWNDDHIHARDCGSKILSTIEEQIRFHDLKNSASK